MNPANNTDPTYYTDSKYQTLPGFTKLLDHYGLTQLATLRGFIETLNMANGTLWRNGICIPSVCSAQEFERLLNKYFSQFPDRSKVWISSNHVTSRSLNHVSGEDWKRVRSIVSPVFTSGKMRQMSPKISACLTDLCAHIDTIAVTGQPLDAWDVCGRFVLDIIARNVFGAKIDAYLSNDNPFVVFANEKFNLTLKKEMSRLLLPKFMQKWLNVSNKVSDQFFLDTVRQIIADRRQKPNKKNVDLIQLLMDADIGDREGQANERDNNNHQQNRGDEEVAADRKAYDINVANKRLTEDEIIAQGYIFFIGGYLETASALAFSAYEMACNPTAQQRLLDEIEGAGVDAPDNDLSYDALARLPYLAAFLSEVQRRHSNTQPMARVAASDYRLGDTGITIKAGQQIEVPNYALHYSDQYYEQPYQFDPERFMPENKHKIKPYAYLPFGAGPRNCIGMRFALLIVKLALAHMVKRYRFYRCPQTDVPVQYKPFIHMISPKRVVV
ncbi:unnamed protein product, partial [Oppiella nova]